jgi:hypothetical protein
MQLVVKSGGTAQALDVFASQDHLPRDVARDVSLIAFCFAKRFGGA